MALKRTNASASRTSYRCGYRAWWLSTRMETMYLMVSKLRSGGYIPFFVTERKRSETALIQVVQKAFMQDISARKMESWRKTLESKTFPEARSVK